MKLKLSSEFSLEIEQANSDSGYTITGTLRPLSKKEKKEFDKEFEKDKELGLSLQTKSEELQSLEKQLNNDLDLKTRTSKESKLRSLQIETQRMLRELLELDTKERTAERRLKLSVQSEQIDKILEVCELVGFEEVLSTISKDVEAKKQ